MLLLDLPKNKPAVQAAQYRKIFCVIEQSYKDREIADGVCEGRFDIAGTELDLGLDPDWVKNPLEEDVEWQIEWHKFYYGLDLASSFAETGDPKFLRVWENLVRSFIRQVPVEFASTDVLARRIQNWVYARQIFADANFFKGFSDDFEHKLLSSVDAQARYLRNNLTPERNHRTLELYALFIVALAFPQTGNQGDLLRFAMDGLTENMLTDIRPDGVQRENSTHYHCTVLRSFLGARENARRFGLKFSREFDERLLKACEFAMHIHRPDGEIPAFSDSDTGSYLDLLKLAGNIFSRPDLLYAGASGKDGTAPEISNVSFTESGYYIQRSGWGTGETAFADEKFMMFDCGPVGDGGHGHYDLLNVEISACGKPLIVDSGRFTYAEDSNTNWRHFFKGTAAHNTVVINGKDQTTYRRGKPKGETAQGVFIERVSLPGLDVLCGKAVSPNYEAVHTRRIFFIRKEFWLIEDELNGTIPHSYDLRFHLTPAAWNCCTIMKTPTNEVVRTPDVALLFEPNGNLSIEPSWYSPRYGIKHRAPCISLVSNAESTRFYTLISPLRFREELPSFVVSNDGPTTSVEISRPKAETEIIGWSLNHERLHDLRLTQK
jgi:hypothetical protein